MPEKKSRARQTEQNLKMRPEPFQHVEEPGNDWLDRLMQFNLHFGRFARDAIGVILLAIAAMTLLGLLGISKGVALAFVTDNLSYWFGWGSYLVAISIGLAGLVILRWEQGTFSFGRFIAVDALDGDLPSWYGDWLEMFGAH
jgi:hypothetical protein